MGSATGKSWGMGKGSWTECQIKMLLSYFVLIKLSVIKCLFNYDNAIINIYKMQVKFINQSKIFLIVSLACFIFCITYPFTNIVISVFTFKTWLTITSTKLYIYVKGRRQDFGSGGTSNKISNMISSQVLLCNGVVIISVRVTFSKIVLIKNF